MIIDFETEECIECDVYIRMINALKDLAAYELNNNGITDKLLIIAQNIEKEARDMTELLSKQAEVSDEQQKPAGRS
jgi:hypothetical protein